MHAPWPYTCPSCNKRLVTRTHLARHNLACATFGERRYVVDDREITGRRPNGLSEVPPLPAYTGPQGIAAKFSHRSGDRTVRRSRAKVAA